MDHLFDEKTDCLTRFLAFPFNVAIHKCRVCLSVFFIILGIGAGIVAAQMGPLSKGEEMMSPDHPLVET